MKMLILAALAPLALAFAQALADYATPKPIEGDEFGIYFVESAK